MYVGQQVDPYFFQQIFKVDSFAEIDRTMSEDEMFADVAESQYLTALNGVIS